MKKIYLLMLFLVCFGIIQATEIYAKEAAYLVVNPVNAVPKHITTLNNLDFNVTLIPSSTIANTDFTKYDLLLINNENFPPNVEELIPVHDYPSMILTRHSTDLNAFKWSEDVRGFSRSNFVTADVYDTEHYITQGIPIKFEPYILPNLPYYYLWRSKSAPGMRLIINRESSLSIPNLNPLLATVSNGTLMRNGVTSRAKNVYFGFTEHQYWSHYTQTIFERSIVWLTTDFEPPQITNIFVNNITKNSATLNWNTNKQANITIRYGQNNLDNIIIIEEIKEGNQNILLTNLEEYKQYNYTIEACNINGYCNISTVRNFMTLDQTPPNAEVIEIKNITNESAEVYIEFNELTNYTIFFYEEIDNVQEINNPIHVISATETISGLNEKTTYYFYINICDIYDNCDITETLSFITDDYTPPNAPNNFKIEADNKNNKVILTWEIPEGEIPEKYNIYISNDLNFNFNEPNYTTSDLIFIDNEATSNENRYYIVRAVDYHNNEEDNQNILMKTILEINQGIGLYSIPIGLQNNSIDSILNMEVNFNPIKELRIFNKASNTIETYEYNNNTNEWNNLTEIQTLEGFFLISYHNAELIIVGYPITTYSIELKQGMNLIGLTIDTNKNILDLDYPTIKEISKRNVITNSFDISTKYNFGWDNKNNINIKPKIGYWIKSEQDTTIMVN
ncbi:MAG: hypothetical protein ACMXYG_00020 [Candidatus Woesearchaeota archaeon]